MSASSTIFYASSTVLVFNALVWLSDQLQASSECPDSRRKKKKAIPSRTIEVCCDSVAAAVTAARGGCNSVELCANRAEGGITPSIGMIKEVVHQLKATNVLIHVLIRPREGDFVYDGMEFDVMLRDIISCMEAGVDGIVVGLLTKDGDIDVERLEIIKNIVGDQMIITFHRAFDQCKDALQALEVIIKASCDRLLTSGQCNSALQGVDELAKLINASNNRINIVAAAGINAENAATIISQTNVTAMHVGSAVVVQSSNAGVESAMKNVNVGLGTSSNIYSFSRVCSNLVTDVVDACRKAWTVSKPVEPAQSSGKKALSVDVDSPIPSDAAAVQPDASDDFVHITKSATNSPRIQLV